LIADKVEDKLENFSSVYIADSIKNNDNDNKLKASSSAFIHYSERDTTKIS